MIKDFQVGDRVKVIHSLAGIRLKGWIGTVVAVGDNIGVEFDEPLPDGGGHDCDKRCKDGYGRYGSRRELKALYQGFDIQVTSMLRNIYGSPS